MSTSSTTATTAFPVAMAGPSSSGVRFTLRKRSMKPNERETMSLSSYNSDFLSGLFADVAKANVLSELDIPETTPPTSTETTTSTSPTRSSAHLIDCEERPTKKSRLSLSSYRSRASCMNLANLSTVMQSPKGITEIASLQKGDGSETHTEVPAHVAVSPDAKRFAFAAGASTMFSSSAANLPKHDSLAFQLSLLGGQDETSFESVSEDVAKLAFPNLPATVSDSSCYNKGLTREISARHVPTCETAASSKESSFGWFVDLDDHHDSPSTSMSAANTLPHAVSTEHLAFKAPTAPKRSADEAELEWAQAADTVDSVLGDLF